MGERGPMGAQLMPDEEPRLPHLEELGIERDRDEKQPRLMDVDDMKEGEEVLDLPVLGKHMEERKNKELVVIEQRLEKQFSKIAEKLAQFNKTTFPRGLSEDEDAIVVKDVNSVAGDIKAYLEGLKVSIIEKAAKIAMGVKRSDFSSSNEAQILEDVMDEELQDYKKVFVRMTEEHMPATEARDVLQSWDGLVDGFVSSFLDKRYGQVLGDEREKIGEKIRQSLEGMKIKLILAMSEEMENITKKIKNADQLKTAKDRIINNALTVVVENAVKKLGNVMPPRRYGKESGQAAESLR